MNRGNDPIMQLMYRGTSTIHEFNWENMQPSRSILSLMTQDDIDSIRKIILSPRYSGNNKLKMQKIDEIMHLRGFTKFAGGTNRIVYEHPEASGMVFKVAIDSEGIKDSPAEFYNQNLLKPFCCKVFECSACGTIASFEKVKRITTVEEFYTIAEDYYEMITNVILNKYVMEDIGIKYFMNFGIRIGFGPVILDFPYLFELDGNKLICNAELEDHSICHGEIDYDIGFNKLICTKCGRHYMARDLALMPEMKKRLLRSKGAAKMRVNVINATNGKVISSYDTNDIRDHLSKDTISSTNIKKEKKAMKVNIVTKRVPITKNETTNHVNNEINATVIDNHIQESTVENAPVKTTEKTITVKLGNKSNNIIKKDKSSSKHLSVNLVMKKVKASNNKKKNNSFDKNTSVDTPVESRKKFNKNDNNVEAPIVKRTINISLGKGSEMGSSSSIIKADTAGHKLNIYTTTTPIKKEEEKIEEVKVEKVVAENTITDNNNEDIKEEEVTKVEEVDVENVAVDDTIKDIKEEIHESNIETISEDKDIDIDSFVSGIPTMTLNEEKEEAKEVAEEAKEEEYSVDEEEYEPYSENEKMLVYYRESIPENLSDYEGAIISLFADCTEMPDHEEVDYTHINLNYDNIYIMDGKAYLITEFVEEDREIKVMLDDYFIEENNDGSAAQIDESETIEEDKGESIAKMSDDEMINKIINASASKPSLKDMVNTK